MVWIFVTLGVALVGLALLGWYVFRLYRKLTALLNELGVLADRAAEALDLLGRIDIPDQLGDRYDAAFSGADGQEDDELRVDARFSVGTAPAPRT